MRTNRPDLSISTESTGAEDDCAATEQRSRHRGGMRQHRRPRHRGPTHQRRHRHGAAAARRPACRGRRRRRYPGQHHRRAHRPGLGPYAAANSWLDAFTSWQRSQGVPASAIAWGAWADIGRGAGVAQRGDVTMIRPEDGGYAFRELLRHDRGYTGYLPLTGMPLLTALAARSPFAESFREADGHQAASAPTVLAELAGLAPDEWPNRLRRLVTDQIGLILRRAADPDRSFADHGLDSLGTLELRTHIETQTGVRLTPTTLVTYSTPRALAGHLTETLEAGAG